MWDSAYKPKFLFFRLTYWCEKENKQKTKSYKEAFMASWMQADKQDRMRVKDLPNFDEGVFFEISGIRVSDYE